MVIPALVGTRVNVSVVAAPGKLRRLIPGRIALTSIVPVTFAATPRVSKPTKRPAEAEVSA